MASRILCVLGILFFCVFVYAVLWLSASVSLAMVDCDNDFRLFHENFRCRQPNLAMILGGTAFAMSGLAFWFAWRQRTKGKRQS